MRRLLDLLLFGMAALVVASGAWQAQQAQFARSLAPSEYLIGTAVLEPTAAVAGSEPRPLTRRPDDVGRTWWLHIGLLVGGFLSVHLILSFTGSRPSPFLLPISLLLSGASAILLFTYTDPLRDGLLYPGFVNGVLAGCGGLVVTARLVRLARLQHYRYLTILAALALSILLVTIGTGPRGTDARINLFGLFQPVEFIKILIVLFLASYFAGKDVELRQLESGRWLGISLPRWRDSLPVVIFVAAMLALFFLQKDLGPALVLYLVFLGFFVVASRRFVLGLLGLAVLLGAFWATYYFRLLGTVSTRIEMWLSPWDNHRPGGVQLAESLWALASGGTFGAGLGRADARFIPAGHTDLILATAAEHLGVPAFVGLLALIMCLVALMAFHAWRAASLYERYLGFGLALLVGVQTALIAAGTVGLVPLTGIPVPLVGYGKSATIAHFLLLGLALNVSARSREAAETGKLTATRRKLPSFGLVLVALVLAAIAAVGWRAVQMMTTEADAILVRGALTPQADGVRRFSYNRRLTDLAAAIPRGRILDGSGLPLATNRREDLESAAAALEPLGLAVDTRARGRRVYPLGRYAAQVVGHGGAVWADPRTVERESSSVLRGYRYRDEVRLVEGHRVVWRDYSGLVPVFRDRQHGRGDALRALVARDRDVGLTLDARLQVATMAALEANLPIVDGVKRTKGAAVVLDAATGQILAAVSLPTYDPNAIGAEDLVEMFGDESRAALDRARFEIYPPGSAFKIVTAAAALESADFDSDRATYTCNHVNEIPWEFAGDSHSRRVRDDEIVGAHGPIGMQKAVVESCNVYFAWLATQIGAGQFFDTAKRRFRLALPHVPDERTMGEYLADHAYGQARVTVTPLEMGAIAAAVANGGRGVVPTLYLRRALVRLKPDPTPPEPILAPATADFLRDAMINVVRAGTGRRAAVDGVVVGGKTGTAETESGDGMAHSWFVGFAYAPEDGPEKAIAFAFLIENGGYGGRAAASAAHDFLVAWRGTPGM